MPLPAAAAGAIAAGAGSLVSSIGNLFGIGKQNRQMVDFWRMQNEYNHPKAQMQRLQEAGLNPNLVYGDSVSGAAGNAGDVGKPEAFKLDNPIRNLTAFADVQQKKVQTDLLQTENTVKQNQAALLNAQTARTVQEQARTKQQFDQADSLFQHQLQAAELRNRQMESQTIGQDLNNDFNSFTYQERVKRLWYEARNAEETYKGNQLINKLRQLEIDLKKLGIEKGDPWYFRILGRNTDLLNQIFKK